MHSNYAFNINKSTYFVLKDSGGSWYTKLSLEFVFIYYEGLVIVSDGSSLVEPIICILDKKKKKNLFSFLLFQILI